MDQTEILYFLHPVESYSLSVIKRLGDYIFSMRGINMNVSNKSILIKDLIRSLGDLLINQSYQPFIIFTSFLIILTVTNQVIKAITYFPHD